MKDWERSKEPNVILMLPVLAGGKVKGVVRDLGFGVRFRKHQI